MRLERLTSGATISAAILARPLGLRRSGRVYVGACPACGYKRAFSVQDADGRVLVRCHAGCEQGAVIGALRRARLWQGRSAGPDWSPVKCANSAEEHKSRIAAAIALWRRSRPPEGTPAASYLRGRGIADAIPPTLRFLADCRHKPTGTRHPAMLGLVQRVGADSPVAVHRTYLRRDGSGRAAIEPNKMTLGPIGGGAVRLAEAGPHLAVAEGIETGLSVQLATDIPTWAALSAGGVTQLILPPLPLASVVTIAADNDPVGLAKAEQAARRWSCEGRHVRIALPPKDLDFNDLLRAGE